MSICHCDPEVMRALGRIEGRLDALEGGVAEAKGAVQGVADRLDEHQSAVSRGGAKSGTAAGVLAGLSVTVLAELIKRGLPT